MISRKTEVRGVIAELSVSAVTHIGDKIPVSVTIRDEGEDRVVCVDRGYLPDCRVSLLNADTQQPATFTRTGYSLLSGEDHAGGSKAHIALSKGESRTWNTDLNKFYTLKPGEYDMTFTTKLNPRTPERSFSITVEKLKFKIIE